MLPNFLILGAPRAATTSLHYYLQEHPDICMSTTKEPNFFLFDHAASPPRPYVGSDPRIVAKSVIDRAAYERLFTKPGATAIGEASPLYLYTRESPEEIARHIPDARLIAIVREPIARAYSHFRYVFTDLRGDAVMPAFRAAVERELPLGYAPYQPGEHSLRLGRYAEQLQRYLDVFPREQLLVLDYDEVVAQPDDSLARICRLLGVADSFGFNTELKYNPATASPSVRLLDRMIRPIRPQLKRALPPRVAAALARRRAVATAGRQAAPDPIPDDLRRRLTDYYADDLAWLAQEFGIDLRD
ncbi:MAG TPA: sulfotransferase [Mycobacteriales bacterium]|nr:sulfotransferase [Mycobacteriales bacterium]